MLLQHGEQTNFLFLFAVSVHYRFLNQCFQLRLAGTEDWFSAQVSACEYPYEPRLVYYASASFPSIPSGSIHIRFLQTGCLPLRSNKIIGSITNPVADGTVTL